MKRTVTKEVCFAAAHFLPEHGKCSALHGHNWNVTIDISTEEEDYDMIIDFNILKNIVMKMDHKLLVGSSYVTSGGDYCDVWWEGHKLTLPHDELYVMEDVPTAENIAKHIATQIAQIIWCSADIMVEVSEGPGAKATHSIKNYTEGDPLND